LQLFPIFVAFGDDPGAASEIFQLEVKDGKFDRRDNARLSMERRRRPENVARDKGSRFLPGLIRVAAKCHQPIKNDPALLLVGDLDLCELNEGAHFVHAAKQDEPRASGAGRLLKLEGVHRWLAGRRPTRQRNDAVLPLRREVTLQSTNKIRGVPLGSSRLIGRLTGCVDIVEIENRPARVSCC